MTGAGQRAAVLNRFQRNAGGELIFYSARFHNHFTGIKTLARDVSGDQPPARQLRRAHFGRPCSPFRRVQGSRVAQKLHRDIAEIARIRRGTSSGAGRYATTPSTASAAPVRRCGRPAIGGIRLRVKCNMHIGQKLPVFLRTTPRQRAAKGVAGGAGAANIVVRNIGFILYAVFRHVHDGLRFFRSQSMRGAEVLHYLAGIFRADLQTVEAHHALERFLPAFGCSAFPGNTGHIALSVALMAATAFCNGSGVIDGDAFFRLFLRVQRRRSTAPALLSQSSRRMEHRQTQQRSWHRPP